MCTHLHAELLHGLAGLLLGAADLAAGGNEAVIRVGIGLGPGLHEGIVGGGGWGREVGGGGEQENRDGATVAPGELSSAIRYSREINSIEKIYLSYE